MVHSAPGKLDLPAFRQPAYPCDHVIQAISGKLFCENGVYIKRDLSTGSAVEYFNQYAVALIGDLAHDLLGLGRWLIDMNKVAPVHGLYSQ